jgi:hypothetical protein
MSSVTPFVSIAVTVPCWRFATSSSLDISGFGAAHFTHNNALRIVPQGGLQRVRNGDFGHRLLGPEAWARARRDSIRTRFGLRMRILDVSSISTDAVAVGNRVGQGIEQRGLPGAGAAGDQDVLARANLGAVEARSRNRGVLGLLKGTSTA